VIIKPIELLCLENQIVDLKCLLVCHPLSVPKLRSSPQARPKTPVLVVHRGGPGWGQKGWIFGMILKKINYLEIFIDNITYKSNLLGPTPTPPRWGGASSNCH
jgi:hypothetical protein